MASHWMSCGILFIGWWLNLVLGKRKIFLILRLWSNCTSHVGVWGTSLPFGVCNWPFPVWSNWLQVVGHESYLYCPSKLQFLLRFPLLISYHITPICFIWQLLPENGNWQHECLAFPGLIGEVRGKWEDWSTGFNHNNHSMVPYTVVFKTEVELLR